MTDGRRVVALVGVGLALAVMAWVILRGDGSEDAGDAAKTAGGERSSVELRGYEPATPALLAAAGWRTEIAVPAALARVRISSVSRDDFVPIRDPLHARADETDLAPEEPVLIVRGETEVRAWPLVWLLERELVVDEVDGIPLVATFCSVCGTSRVWERRTEGTESGETLELRVSGLLMDGNSLLYDEATETLWRQDDGVAVVGARAGERLVEVPSFVLSLGALRGARADALVMQAPAPDRVPGVQMISGEDVEAGIPPEWLQVACERPLESVIRLDETTVVPVTGPVVENIGEWVIFRDSTMASPFRGAQGGPGPRVGGAVVFGRRVEGRLGELSVREGEIVDDQGRAWSILGENKAGSSLSERTQARVGLRLAGWPR